MLRWYRRPWFIIFGVVLIAPMLFQLLGSSSNDVLTEEQRALSKFPSLPRSPKDLRALPRRVDAYLNDHYGLRLTIIDVHTTLNRTMFPQSGNTNVIIGYDGWMFYRGDRALQQSAGLVVRSARVEYTADVLAAMRTALATRAVNMIVAIPPNTASVYHDKIRGWNQESVRATEYDVLLQALTRRDVPAVDIRSVLRDERASGPTHYSHDTHWTPRGALAAFNAISAHIGKPSRQIDPRLALGSAIKTVGGDLARMLNLNRSTSEWVEPLALKGGNRHEISERPLVYELKPDSWNRTVMVIGDSSAHILVTILSSTGANAIWLEYDSCGFEWRWVESLQPDEVWIVPTERLMLCEPKKRPNGLAPASR